MPWEWLLPLALIPAFWAGLCLSIASISGWSRLAEKYRADREPMDGPRWNWSFLRIGWCDYNGCLIYRVAPEGLYIAVWAMFVCHPPLLIPWGDIRILSKRESRWYASAKCEVGNPKVATLTLPLDVLKAAAEWLKSEEAKAALHRYSED